MHVFSQTNEGEKRGMCTSGPMPSRQNPWPVLPGEMPSRIRTFDWSATPLGPIHTWPDHLRNAIDLMLSCGFSATLQWGPQATLLYNDPYIPLIGTRHPTALGRSIFETFPEIRSTYEPLFQRVRQGETVVFEDLPYRYTRDEHLIDTWFNLSYSPVHDNTGSVCGVMAIGFETTSRVALRRSEELYRTLFENIDDGCMIIEQLPLRPDGLRDYRYILMNSSSRAMFGIPDLTGQSVRDNFPREDEEWYDFYDEVIETGKPMRFERPASSIGMIIEMFLARVGGQEEKRLLVLMRDITERRRAQEAIRQTEKLAVVGRLASSIAHEINNPLAAVTNLVYLARQQELSPDTAALLDQADRELRRVSLITSETLRFHRQYARPSRHDLTELLESILLLHESRLLQAQITTERRYGPHPEITCLPNEIRQVLANLISNSIEAMSNNSGRRLLTLRMRGSAETGTGLPGLTLIISDTGPGMNPAAKVHAFEPFFTTKEATNSGLGLWISNEIVLKHGGRLRFRSRHSGKLHGTVFTLFLPENPTM